MFDNQSIKDAKDGEVSEKYRRDGGCNSVYAVADWSVRHIRTRKGKASEEQPFVFEPLKAAREHPHNKLIHVPVGFALAAFAVSLLSVRRKELQPAARLQGVCPSKSRGDELRKNLPVANLAWRRSNKPSQCLATSAFLRSLSFAKDTFE